MLSIKNLLTSKVQEPGITEIILEMKEQMEGGKWYEKIIDQLKNTKYINPLDTTKINHLLTLKNNMDQELDFNSPNDQYMNMVEELKNKKLLNIKTLNNDENIFYFHSYTEINYKPLALIIYKYQTLKGTDITKIIYVNASDDRAKYYGGRGDLEKLNFIKLKK